MEVFNWISDADFTVPRPSIISGVLASILAYLVISKYRRDRDLPPMGSISLPIIGSTFSLIGDQVTRTFQRMSKKVGPVFRVYLGPKPVVVLNDLDSVRQAFAKTGDDMCSRPATGRIGGLVTSPLTPLFKEHRKFSLLSLRSLGMGRNTMEDRITQEMDHLVQALDETKGKPVNPEPLITRSVSNVISAMAFGERFDYEDENFQILLGFIRNVTQSKQTAVNFIANLPIARQVTGLVNRIRKRNSSKKLDFRGVVRSFVDSSAEASTKGDDQLSYIGTYVKEMNRKKDDGESGDAFSAHRLTENTIDLFFAGTETTSTSLRWALLIMITHPDIQKQIQDEIDRVIGSDRHPAIKDRPNLPYTEAFLMELQRFASVVALGVPHTALVDTMLYDYHIPKDMLIITNIWGILHDPDVWDEPEKIKPERFLDADGKVIYRDEFIPFSIGRRKCLGEQLAVMEVYLTFTRLVQQFTFRLPEGAPTPSLEGVLRITHMPQPYELRACRR